MVHVKFTIYIEYNLVRSFQTSLFLQNSLLDQCLAVVRTRPNKVKVLSDLETVDIYHEGFVHNLKEVKLEKNHSFETHGTTLRVFLFSLC